MDEFGVLVESIGFKAHGKSAPMAKRKIRPNSNFRGSGGMNTSSFNDSSFLPVDELDGIFRSNVTFRNSSQSRNLFGDDDVFGGSSQYGAIDLESVLDSSNYRKSDGDGHSRDSVSFDVCDDLLGSKSKNSDPVDDLIGNFGVSSVEKHEKPGSGFDDLIPDFGGANSPKQQGSKANLSSELNGHSSEERFTVEDDPFIAFESSIPQADASWPFNSPSEQGNGMGSSSLEELDEFAAGRPRNDSRTKATRTTAEKPTAGTAPNGFENVDVLDAIFGGGAKQNHTARPSSTSQDPLFGTLFQQKEANAAGQTSSWSSSSTSMTSSLFGDITTSSEDFYEIEGEPVERQRARIERLGRMKARMAKALYDKNQRDFQNLIEQEEKHRLAESLNSEIRRWAAGKEGNLRALLSSLQQILWPECGWRPVPLTDMITSDSVKKVYKKATLYVHPDKVQQKGANLQQTYVAEKVFDLLKEAWNKFSAEELR